MTKFKYKTVAERFANRPTCEYQPNLNPEVFVGHASEYNAAEDWLSPEQLDELSAETEEFLLDLETDYCDYCNGLAYTIQFGKRVPCPYGVKHVLVHSNKIVCYHIYSTE